MRGDGDAARGASPGGDEQGPGGPLWLHAVVRRPLAGRTRRWLGPRVEGAERAGRGAGAAAPGPDGTRRVALGRLSAVVSSAAEGGEAPEEADPRPDRHARIVEELAETGAVVPAPPGLRAEGEPAVRVFLDRARLALEEALDLFDGACEARLHVRRRPDSPGPGSEGAPAPGGGDAARSPDAPGADAPRFGEATAAADGLYRRLRRQARAARRLPTVEGDLLTAALLVRRADLDRTTGTAARWQEARPGLEAEVTGPWPPYAFVRMFPLHGEGVAGDGASGEGPTEAGAT